MDGDQIQYLIELLDDDNEQSVQLAMAALLKSDDASLDSCLSKLQQSRNTRLQKRVRQLETALQARRNRKNLEKRLKRSSLLEGCVQLHLCWFDNDQAELVYKQWNDLLADYRIGCGGRPSLTSVADFMAKKEFHAPMNDDLAADNTNYQPIVELIVELYSDVKDFEHETTVETALNSAGLVYDKRTSYIESERMYLTTYTTEVLITNG